MSEKQQLREACLAAQAFICSQFCYRRDVGFHVPDCHQLQSALSVTEADEKQPDETGAQAFAQALLNADTIARLRGDKFGLCDSVDNAGNPYPSQWVTDLLAHARTELELATEITKHENHLLPSL